MEENIGSLTWDDDVDLITDVSYSPGHTLTQTATPKQPISDENPRDDTPRPGVDAGPSEPPPPYTETSPPPPYQATSEMSTMAVGTSGDQGGSWRFSRRKKVYSVIGSACGLLLIVTIILLIRFLPYLLYCRFNINIFLFS